MATAEDGHGADERAGGGLLEQVAEDDHERPLGALGAPERELVVAVHRSRLEVEERAHHGLTAGTPGRERGADLVVERDRAGAVAELVGDERQRGRGVEADVQDRGSVLVEWRRREPPGVEQEQQVAVLLEPVLVAHRPPEACRRAPVDLADVVVGLVVADQLELRAQTERAAGRRALVPEPPAGDGQRQPARGAQVREDAYVGRGPDAVVPAREPERPRRPRRDRGQHVPPAPPRDDLAAQSTVALALLDHERRGRRLPHAHGAAGRRGGGDPQLGRNPAREHLGNAPLDGRCAPGRDGVDRDGSGESEHGERDDGDRKHQR